MFRISANYDDPYHPLQGDVRTVASVAEAMAAMPDAYLDDADVAEEISRLFAGCDLFCIPGDFRVFVVERI